MILFVALLLLVCIALPLAFAWSIWRLDEKSRAAWLLVVTHATLITTLVILLGRWDIAGHYTRFFLISLLVVAIVRSFLLHRHRPWLTGSYRSLVRVHLTSLVSTILVMAALGYVVSGTFSPKRTVELVLPLEGGRFMIGQGGGNSLLNKHSDHPAQRFAADITAIGATGFRASGILPRKLESYVIYGSSVVSPCGGTVVSARDGLPDLVPPERDPQHPAGNHAIIDCGGVRIELAHLGEGSLSVVRGEEVEVGDRIGDVGNSGNTTEPHLHVHAVDPESGLGIAMSFNGRMPYRNRLYEP